MMDFNQTYRPSPPRHHHFFNAISAVLLIVWEMQGRFNIGVRSIKRG